MLLGGFPHAFRDLVSCFLGVRNKAALPDGDDDDDDDDDDDVVAMWEALVLSFCIRF